MTSRTLPTISANRFSGSSIAARSEASRAADDWWPAQEVELFSHKSLFYSYAMNTRLVLLLTSALGVGATVLAAATTRWQYGLALYAMTVVGLAVLLRRAAAKHRRSARQ